MRRQHPNPRDLTGSPPAPTRRRPAAGRPHAWNPADYAAHSGAQHLWARELLNRLALTGHERVVDVGCGDGGITAELARALPHGHVLGIDSSADMIRHAREAWPAARLANLRFEVMDARSFTVQAPVDIVFSNAALHWVDDHPAFLRAAAAALRPGGRLAVSCGGRGNAAEVFRAVRAVLRDPRWRDAFRALPQPYHFHGPEAYAGWLEQAGLLPVSVQLQPKTMTQPHRDAFAGWVRTTWLPYTTRVPAAQREPFIAAVVDRYLASHPPAPDGSICVRMVRLEILGERLGTR